MSHKHHRNTQRLRLEWGGLAALGAIVLVGWVHAAAAGPTVSNSERAIVRELSAEIERRDLAKAEDLLLQGGDEELPPGESDAWTASLRQHAVEYASSDVDVFLDLSMGSLGAAPDEAVLREHIVGIMRVIGNNDVSDPERMLDALDRRIERLRDLDVDASTVVAVRQATERRVDLTAATVLLAGVSEIETLADGQVRLRTENVYRRFNICREAGVVREPLVPSQPSVGFCSGVFVSTDQILTAEHCLSEGPRVEDIRVISGFVTKDGVAPEVVPRHAVGTVTVELRGSTSGGGDWALLKVRGMVAPKVVEISRAPLSFNTIVYAAGHPLGLPRKIIAVARTLLDRDGGLTETDLDTYAGNSGSPVFSMATDRLVGLVIQGECDFTSCDPAGCRTPVQCRGSNCKPELILRIDRFRARLEAKIHQG